jgi:glucose/arabinose dehydrogenase
VIPRRALSSAALAAATLVVAGSGLAACGGDTRGRRPSSALRSPNVLISIGAGLKGPAGLSGTVYAHGPKSTATFAFDGKGRLWLTAAGLESHTHDGVYMVAKAGARALRVVSGLDDPLGIVWRGGALFVASVGRVDEYSEFDGKSFRRHVEIVHGPVTGGENNNLVLAPDGRLVMGITASCDHCKPASSYSGSIVSFRQNGSDLRIYARAIRAPVGLAFLPGTNTLFASMNQRDDLKAKTPGDWFSLVREGENWRSPSCYGQGGAACRGVPRPTAVLDKHGAVGGIAMVSARLAAGTGSSALVAEWAASKVEQVSLRKSGSSYTGTVSTFLTGIRNPLAIVRSSDGSLLVGDWSTGVIYRIAAA